MATLENPARASEDNAAAGPPSPLSSRLLIISKEPLNASRTETPPVVAPRHPRFSVLVADDDNSLVEIISQILTFAGYDVVVATDGEQAWQAYLERGCDLLLTDQDMPRLSGLELVDRIRSHGGSVPIVLTSGRVACEDIPDILRDQIDAVIAKPLTIDLLLETIRGALRRRTL